MKRLCALFLGCNCLVLATGCGQDPKPAQATPDPNAGSAQSVVVAKVLEQQLTKKLHLPGELCAFRNVGLYAKVQGFVQEISVDRGSVVTQGQLLAQLTAPEFEAQCNEQKAKLTADALTYKRLKEAARVPGVVAGNDVKIAEKTVDAERARLAACAQNEAYLRIEAPFDGIITERNVHEGSMVGPNLPNAVPMLRVQEIARLRLVVSVPEMAVGAIPAGTRVQFTVSAYPGEVFTGTIAREAFSIDARTRTMPVELDVENADKRLSPGMFAEVRWEVTRATPSLFVPSSAIVTTTERRFVVRIRNGSAEWVDVQIGQPLESMVEVFGDLHSGDQVAARGTDEIRPGTTIRVKEAS